MNKDVSFKDRQVIRKFSEGFIEDNIYVALFPNIKRRRFFLKHFMRAYLFMLQGSCNLWSNEECYALIYDPEKTSSSFKLYKDYYIGLIKGLPIILLVGIKGYKRIIKDLVLEGSSWLDEVENYIHLDMIVVDKERRGKGLAKEMISRIISEAGKSEKKITLETQNPKNRDLYEHLGFELYKTTFHIKYHEYCMVLDTGKIDSLDE